jgi:SMODS and SLOG-associating 2TM effector domain 1
VTTVGAAVTAHIAAARYEHLVISYLSTARQLRFLLRSWEGRPDKTAEAAGRLVRECEDVISRENESWMAAWSRGEDPALPSSAAP